MEWNRAKQIATKRTCNNKNN